MPSFSTPVWTGEGNFESLQGSLVQLQPVSRALHQQFLVQNAAGGLAKEQPCCACNSPVSSGDFPQVFMRERSALGKQNKSFFLIGSAVFHT